MALDPGIVPVIAAGVSVITAVIAAMAALIVPARSFRFARLLETDKRLFERRAEIYVELLAHLWAIRDIADPLSRAPATDTSPEEMTGDKPRQLVAKVHAFATPQIVDAHTRFSVAFMTWLDASERRATATGEVYATQAARRALAIAELREALTALEERIREELQPEGVRQIGKEQTKRLYRRRDTA